MTTDTLFVSVSTENFDFDVVPLTKDLCTKLAAKYNAESKLPHDKLTGEEIYNILINGAKFTVGNSRYRLRIEGELALS